MLNHVVLIGRLTRDPELRYVASGHAVANFTLAIDRPFKNARGERDTDFIDVTAWRRHAEVVGQYVHKGQLLAVNGRIEIQSYEGSDGARRRATRVIADRVMLFPRTMNGTLRTEAASSPAAAPSAEDAVPF